MAWCSTGERALTNVLMVLFIIEILWRSNKFHEPHVVLLCLLKFGPVFYLSCPIEIHWNMMWSGSSFYPQRESEKERLWDGDRECDKIAKVIAVYSFDILPIIMTLNLLLYTFVGSLHVDELLLDFDGYALILYITEEKPIIRTIRIPPVARDYLSMLNK